jgi:hypothetical protein
MRVETRRVGIALADALCHLGGGGSLWLKASIVGEGGPCSFELYPGICLKTQENHGKSHSVQPSSWGQLVAPTWTSFGATSAGLLSISAPRLPVGGFSQPLVGTGTFQVAEIMSSPHQQTLSRNSVTALMWSAKNGIPKSSRICLLLTYKGV